MSLYRTYGITLHLVQDILKSLFLDILVHHNERETSFFYIKIVC